jgi:hypothetical protein
MVPISDETFDRMREAWFAGIPEHFRARTAGIRRDPYNTRGAIIAPKPQQALLERWLSMVYTPHVTQKSDPRAKMV